MKKVLIAIMTVSVFFTSCKGDGEAKKSIENSTNNTELKSEKKEQVTASKAICLLDKLSIRETPKAKGKWITAMSLGEEVGLTGEEVTDSISKKVYTKVKLIDGKEGWTPKRFMAINGKVAVMLESASVYQRPDLLTKTEKKYSAMDIVAVTGEQGDWLQIKGKRGEGKYIEEAWIKSSNISESTVDIATAKFANIALAKETMTLRIQALKEVLANNDLAGSSFVDLLKDKIADYESKNTQAAKDQVPEAEE